MSGMEVDGHFDDKSVTKTQHYWWEHFLCISLKILGQACTTRKARRAKLSK